MKQFLKFVLINGFPISFFFSGINVFISHQLLFKYTDEFEPVLNSTHEMNFIDMSNIVPCSISFRNISTYFKTWRNRPAPRHNLILIVCHSDFTPDSWLEDRVSSTCRPSPAIGSHVILKDSLSDCSVGLRGLLWPRNIKRNFNVNGQSSRRVRANFRRAAITGGCSAAILCQMGSGED